MDLCSVCKDTIKIDRLGAGENSEPSTYSQLVKVSSFGFEQLDGLDEERFQQLTAELQCHRTYDGYFVRMV